MPDRGEICTIFALVVECEGRYDTLICYTERIAIQKSRSDTYRDTEVTIRYVSRYRSHDPPIRIVIQTTLIMSELTQT